MLTNFFNYSARKEKYWNLGCNNNTFRIIFPILQYECLSKGEISKSLSQRVTYFRVSEITQFYDQLCLFCQGKCSVARSRNSPPYFTNRAVQKPVGGKYEKAVGYRFYVNVPGMWQYRNKKIKNKGIILNFRKML